MKEKSKINFGLSKVSTEQFAIISEVPKDEKDIKLNTNYKFTANTQHRAIATLLKITFYNNDSPLLLLETGCHFVIEEKSWDGLFDEENKVVTLPKGFASHLAMISMGTTRGILHSKTENTPYNKYMLPLMNVSNMIESEIKIQIDQVKRTRIEIDQKTS